MTARAVDAEIKRIESILEERERADRARPDPATDAAIDRIVAAAPPVSEWEPGKLAELRRLVGPIFQRNRQEDWGRCLVRARELHGARGSREVVHGTAVRLFEAGFQFVGD